MTLLGGSAAGQRLVILASTSAIRARMLRDAGVTFEAAAARVDEEEVKLSLRADGATPEMVAETLAELKAERVASRFPQALVIGCDQMLECGGRWFDKPESLDAARNQLLALSGKTHRLISSVVVALGGSRIWHHTETARLTMRPFDAAFVDQYLAAAGTDILSSVGAYHLEGLGGQLFSRIDGDYFAILGLPLLPLLGLLREHDIVPK